MILLVANSRDFATDRIVAQLLKRGEEYYRLDLDLAHNDRVLLDPVRRRFSIEREGKRVVLEPESLRAVLYRAPTHLRESSGRRWRAEELLSRHQWAALARGLSIYDQALWINPPGKTYAAECKPFQLMVAARLGFAVPETMACNTPPPANSAVWRCGDNAAVKALDSFLVRLEGRDAFFYTQALARSDATTDALSAMPVVLQEYLEDKLDIRVTVVGRRCYAAEITEKTGRIRGDWRLAKDRAIFRAHDLPLTVQELCISLVKELGLVFGAIDLALTRGEYYFLEINPTGEWGWLVDALSFPIDEALADALCAG